MPNKEYDERELNFDEEPSLYGQDSYEGLNADTFGERIKDSDEEEEAAEDEVAGDTKRRPDPNSQPDDESQ